MLSFFRRRRRLLVKAAAFPEEWRNLLNQRSSYWRRLPSEEKARLEGIIQVLLAEKHFEGCGGLSVEDTHRVLTAAYAGILLLGAEREYYPALTSILLYPDAFVVSREDANEAGIVAEGEEAREGESWDRGTVILSWRDVVRDLKAFDGRNIIFHEFAHQLYESASRDWLPKAAWNTWMSVFEEHFEQHCQWVEQRRPSFFDEYGAEDPAEFFAVATEAFFERPQACQRRFPVFYEQLCIFYQQDPRDYFQSQG